MANLLCLLQQSFYYSTIPHTANHTLIHRSCVSFVKISYRIRDEDNGEIFFHKGRCDLFSCQQHRTTTPLPRIPPVVSLATVVSAFVCVTTTTEWSFIALTTLHYCYWLSFGCFWRYRRRLFAPLLPFLRPLLFCEPDPFSSNPFVLLLLQAQACPTPKQS